MNINTMKKNEAAALLGRLSVKKQFSHMTKQELSDYMKKVRAKQSPIKNKQ